MAGTTYQNEFWENTCHWIWAEDKLSLCNTPSYSYQNASKSSRKDPAHTSTAQKVRLLIIINQIQFYHLFLMDCNRKFWYEYFNWVHWILECTWSRNLFFNQHFIHKDSKIIADIYIYGSQNNSRCYTIATSPVLALSHSIQSTFPST